MTLIWFLFMFCLFPNPNNRTNQEKNKQNNGHIRWDLENGTIIERNIFWSNLLISFLSVQGEKKYSDNCAWNFRGWSWENRLGCWRRINGFLLGIKRINENEWYLIENSQNLIRNLMVVTFIFRMTILGSFSHFPEQEFFKTKFSWFLNLEMKSRLTFDQNYLKFAVYL